MKNFLLVAIVPAVSLVVGCSSTPIDTESTAMTSSTMTSSTMTSSETTSSETTSPKMVSAKMVSSEITSPKMAIASSDSDSSMGSAETKIIEVADREDSVSIDMSLGMDMNTVTTQTSPDIEYICEHNASKRVIRVLNDTASGYACEVSYEKPSSTTILWNAQNDKGYCVGKAAEFAVKQVNWGWHCVDSDGVIVSAPAAEDSESSEIEALATES